MSRRRVLIVSPLVAAALVVAAVRWSGPRASTLVSELPYVSRVPPPLALERTALRVSGRVSEEVRLLHARGATGRHVGIAVIDRPLLTTHREFEGRLRWYDEIDTDPDEPAGWHSTAIASIAAGRDVGAAPGADLYAVGVGLVWSGEIWTSPLRSARRAVHTGQTLPLAIHRVLALNRTLPADRKIRVIAIALGGGASLFQAIEDARREGLFVSAADLLLPPVGPVLAASAASADAYASYDTPAASWAIARLAGLYALASEEDPSMTPERFLRERGVSRGAG